MITVIYDGQCQLCQNSINWLSKKLTFEAVGYQLAQLEKYGGVAAVIFLLHARGNRIAALLLKISGPLGSFAYKLIAANRKSLLVRSLSKLLEKLT